MNEQLKIKFSAKHLPRLALFKGEADIRYYLNGIKIERAEIGGLYLIACDGHTLAVIHDKDGTMEGDDESTSAIMVASKGLIAACKDKYQFASTGAAKVIVNGLRVSVADDFDREHTFLETFIQPGNPWLEGKYPDWRRVLPDFAKLKHGMVAAINSAYMARYDRLTRLSGGAGRYGKFSEITFWQEEPDRAVIVQHSGTPEMLSLIMPVRFDSYDVDTSIKKFQQFPMKVAA